MPRNPPFVILGIIGWVAGYGIGRLLEWVGGPDLKTPLAIAFGALGVLCGLLSMEKEIIWDLLSAAAGAALAAGAVWLAGLAGWEPLGRDSVLQAAVIGAAAGYIVRKFVQACRRRARRKAIEAAGGTVEEGFKADKASYLVYFLVCLPAYGLVIYCFYVRLVAS
ncbi:MAG: hypothetical protein OXL97_05055 [Chloroflexota bacterium]|nr:hypothetical protein [Chloroflexota bacterium]MDE2885760.1 hypothetical protein [Chloroflexota bacterium]